MLPRRIAYEESNDAPEFYRTKADLDLWPFNQMPVLELENGTRLAQQASTHPLLSLKDVQHTRSLADMFCSDPRSQEAICRYLAATNGYTTGASDPLLQYRIDALGAAVEDLCNNYVDSIYDRTEPLGCKLKPFLEGPAVKGLKQLEHLLSKEGAKPYWFADKPAYSEFTLFHLSVILE